MSTKLKRVIALQGTIFNRRKISIRDILLIVYLLLKTGNEHNGNQQRAGSVLQDGILYGKENTSVSRVLQKYVQGTSASRG